MTRIRRKQLAQDVSVGATKQAVRLATVANDTLSGLAVRDGVTPVAGDRVLVKAQTTPSQNGIYVAAAGAWARAADFDSDADADAASMIPVSEGTASAGTAWQLTTAAPISLGVTSLTFEIIGNAGTDPGAHGTAHNPGGADAITTAAAVGLNANSTNTEGVAASAARSDHTHDLDTAGGAISTINAGDAAAEGAGTGVSRRDHQHAVATAAPTGAVEIGDTGVEGVLSSLARADHIHPVAAPAAPVNVTKAVAAAGVAVEAARADHKHDITTAAAAEITDATNSEGVATSLARSDHGHSHGNRGGGSLHAVAVASVSNGFISAADQAKLDAIVDPRFRDFKESVQLKTQGNVTLSGEQTIDGVLTSSSRVAVFSQTVTTQDGIYQTAAGAWTREADFQAGDGVAGAFFAVREGTLDGDTTWLVTNDTGSDVVGTNDLVVAQIGAGSPRGAGAGLVLNINDLDVVANADGSMVVNPNDIQVGVLATDAQHGVRGGGTQHAEVVASGAAGFQSGADKAKVDGIAAGATANVPRQERITTQNINGTDTAITDTLNNTPVSNASVLLFLNGQQLIQGAGEDYTVAGNTITWLASSGTAPNLDTNDDLVAYYDSAA